MFELESNRLILRDHLPSDIESFCALEMDRDMRRYVGGQPRTRPEAERRFEGNLSQHDSRLGLKATILKSTGEYVGRCGVYAPHLHTEEASLSLAIMPPFWGLGLATEAGEALADYGFSALNLTRIITTIQIENLASRRVLEKLGFRCIGREDGPRTFEFFELRRSEWESSSRSRKVSS